jgi:hypothetical protein
MTEATAAAAAIAATEATKDTATTVTTVPAPASTPSPLPFVALAEQTFTPLSMDTSDFFSPDKDAHETKPSPAPEADRLLSASRSMEHLRRTGNLSRTSSNSTAPGASPALSTVSAMVESFEALQAATATSTLGYELLRSKSAAQRPVDLVSPPTTLSPAPSFSRSPSPSRPPCTAGGSPAPGPDAFLTAQSLGAAVHTTRIAAQDENTTAAPLTAAATPNPAAPSAPVPNASSEPRTAADSLPTTATTATTTVVAAELPLIRPTPSSSSPSPSSQPQRIRALSNPSRPPILRTSSSASLSLSHPAPDLNKLSQAGNFLGNIAALEATAERLSMTSSIEDAIREEHNELKRTESRRSSILRARAASAASDTASVFGQSQLSVASRQNSILGINTAARLGGYSPGGFVMSPHNSMSGTSGRLRAGSKASSIGMPSHIPEKGDGLAGTPGDADHVQEFRFLPRHGPGKASTRSVASRVSLAQIAELEQPTALTQAAFDEADRAAASGEPSDEDALRASAHQFIEAEFADDAGAPQPLMNYGFPDESAPRLQLHQPDEYQPYGVYAGDDDRPATSASHTTFEQAQAAFGDFDGVHCDPEASDFAASSSTEPAHHDLPARALHAPPAPRPTTYFDPTTGQQMMFYPAPVPAMLNLPPKLSKKPKAAVKNVQRFSAMPNAVPKASRESRVWLPDPVEGLRTGNDDAPFMSDLLGEDGPGTDPTAQAPGMEAETSIRPEHARHASEASTIHPPPEQREIRRPQRLADADNRKSRLPGNGAPPPQLRASVFFDLPSESPKVQLKDGSAMDTLDSLLDASAMAPVSAFTDHVFAGKLGAEVYGPEKKRKAKKAAPAAGPAVPPTEEKAKRKTLVKRNSSGNLLEPSAEDKPKRNVLVKRNSSGNLLAPQTEKKRASRFSFFGPKRTDDESESDDDGDEQRSGRRSLDEDSPDQLAPDADEETDEESEEEGQLYRGAPTTLLAELQLRKQQNKLRTRPLQHPDGMMRSTLLQLDAVAEVERKARHGKRVTLAWEDPAAVPRDEDDEDDDVPLGMLYAAKATGGGNRTTMDISALMSEVHRPLGLMERREMEENEPLSRRRDRLQGRVSENLPTSLTELQKRMSHMPGGVRSQSRLGLPLPAGGGSRAGSMLGSRPGSAAGNAAEESDPEIAGETLAARKARLAAENPLPRARPVSGAFSAELLREFVGPDDDASKANPSASTATHDTADEPVPEEEESLGQRRRRLQREREAREREMAFSSLTRAATPLGLNPTGASTIRPVRAAATGGPASLSPMGLADVLGAHPPSGHPIMTMDPRERERLRREAEAARHQRETEAKMAALRAQMPTNLTAPSFGGRQGGYMSGRYNDGFGGSPHVAGGGLGYGNPGGLLAVQQQQQQQQQRASTLLGVQQQGMAAQQGPYSGSTPNLGVYGGGVGASMSVNALPMQMPMPMQMQVPGYGMQQMQMQMPMQMGGQGHMDMVERWRQGVMP